MVTPSQLIKRVNEWLKEKSVGPLNSREIVYVIKKMMNITDKSTTIHDLELNLAVSTAMAVCELRGYEVPDSDIINWRGKEIKICK